MRLSKKRGSRFYGRGHKKHKSGSRGGVGFAGSKKHNKIWAEKMRARIPVKKDKFISFTKLTKIVPNTYVVEMPDFYVIDTRKIYKVLGPKTMLNNKPVKYIGNNHAKFRDES